MTEDLVRLETALLAKEAGFDWPVSNSFHGTETYREQNWGKSNVIENWNMHSQHVSRPTQSLLQKWLRGFNFHIEVAHYNHLVKEEKLPFSFTGEWLAPDGCWSWVDWDGYDDIPRNFDTYEKALEEVLIGCLKLKIKYNINYYSIKNEQDEQ